MFNMESRVCNPGILNLSVQNALDCISENVLISKIFPGERAPETPYKSAPFAVLMGAIYLAILPLYIISLGPLYHKILRPLLLNLDIVQWESFLISLSYWF